MWCRVKVFRIFDTLFPAMICFIYPRHARSLPPLTHIHIDDEDSILERSSATRTIERAAPPSSRKNRQRIKNWPKTQFWGECGQYSWIYWSVIGIEFVTFTPTLSRTARKPLIGTQNVIGIESVMRLDFFSFMNAFFEGSLFDRNRTNESIMTKICNTLHLVLYNLVFRYRFSVHLK